MESISYAAFKDCGNLEEVHIPDNINFDDTEFTIAPEPGQVVVVGGEKVVTASESWFENCTNLKKVRLPKGTPFIAKNMFRNCFNLTEIEIPDTVTEIRKDAFNLDGWREYVYRRNGDENAEHGLRSIVIPDSVTTIDNNAFYRQKSLAQVKLSSNLTSLGESAFSYSGIVSLTIPGSLKTIPCAFENCEELKEVTISEGVKRIKELAISTCPSLKKVDIPESVSLIEYGAFRDNENMTEAIIRSKELQISKNAFGYYYSQDTGNDLLSDKLTIYGYTGTDSEKYAKDNGLKFKSIEEYAETTLRGDANCDNQVNIADAVLVMQVATNPDKYAQGKSALSISAIGEANADVDGRKGLSNSDALLIQKFKLGLIKSFES